MYAVQLITSPDCFGLTPLYPKYRVGIEMPPKRVPKSAEECMLLYGKHNNVIKWKEHMQTIVTELYGIIGMFFTTNERYELPRSSIRDYPVELPS